MSRDPDDEILIEMNRIGGAMEVRAVSGFDGLEVVFPAPVSAAKSDIEKLARAKLNYVRRKSAGTDTPDKGSGGASGKGGLIA